MQMQGTYIARTNNMKKGKLGWNAEAEFMLEARQDGDRVLRVSTSKSARGLQSFASVSLHQPNGIITHVFGAGDQGDFSERIINSDKRATEKNVRDQQQEAVDMVGKIMLRIVTHYAAVDARSAQQAAQRTAEREARGIPYVENSPAI